MKSFDIEVADGEVSIAVSVEGDSKPALREIDVVIHGAPELTTIAVNGEFKYAEKNTEKTCAIHL